MKPVMDVGGNCDVEFQTDYAIYFNVYQIAEYASSKTQPL